MAGARRAVVFKVKTWWDGLVDAFFTFSTIACSGIFARGTSLEPSAKRRKQLNPRPFADRTGTFKCIGSEPSEEPAMTTRQPF